MLSRETEMEGSRSVWRRWFGILGWALMILATAGFFIHVWQKIASGDGLDTYFTGFGVQFNYLGVAVLVARRRARFQASLRQRRRVAIAGDSALGRAREITIPRPAADRR
jgi:hypothetical protein